jgi:magnesium transporter
LIRTLAVTNESELIHNLSLEQLALPNIAWYWVDFSAPDIDEVTLLETHFHFHPLAIEDCLHFLQRPKLDYYDGYSFFVLHALNQETLIPDEVDLFVGNNYIVSFHQTEPKEMEEAWGKVCEKGKAWKNGPVYIAYLIMDKLVDNYFPAAYKMEDDLEDLDENTKGLPGRVLMDQMFELRADLLKLRRTIVSMRDLFYRVLNSERLEGFKEHRIYFADIYDHLLRLSEIVDSSREMTADMRDNYISLNSNRMNSIMMTLTIISSIFIPLTFIAGIYGMNFEYMPELKWHYGYYDVLGGMFVIGFGMFLWFRRKGWFDS